MQRVKADLSRVNHVLAALDEVGIRNMSDLLGPEVQYSMVKYKLVTAYAVPHVTCFRAIVQPGDMGDRYPSQLLRNMQIVLPDSIGNAALKKFWLQKLHQPLPPSFPISMAHSSCWPNVPTTSRTQKLVTMYPLSLHHMSLIVYAPLKAQFRHLPRRFLHWLYHSQHKIALFATEIERVLV